MESTIDYRSVKFEEGNVGDSRCLLATKGTYFHPIDRNSEMKIESQIKKIVESSTVKNHVKEIYVYGRKIVPNYTYGKLARFHFRDICAKDLGLPITWRFAPSMTH